MTSPSFTVSPICKAVSCAFFTKKNLPSSGESTSLPSPAGAAVAEDFLEDVAKRRAEKDKSPEEDAKPKTLTVQVDGQAYRVTVAYGDTELPVASAATAAPAGEGICTNGIVSLHGFHITNDITFFHRVAYLQSSLLRVLHQRKIYLLSR